MEQKINELLQKCIANGLGFEYRASTNSIEIIHFVRVRGGKVDIVFDTYGYLDESAAEVDRLHHEVDTYLEGDQDD